jgi:hypothetical protein
MDCSSGTDEPWKPLGPPETSDEAQICPWVAENGPGSGDAPVRREGKVQTAAQAETVDPRHDYRIRVFQQSKY